VYGYQPPVAPPREAMRRPVRIEPVPGTPYGLAIYDSPPAIAGQAIGALLAGIAAVLVSFVVSCAGLGAAAAAGNDQSAGWGPLVGGAFTVLAGFLGLAGIGLGLVGIRRTRPGLRADGHRIRGRGLAIAGVACGAVGLTIAVCSLGFAIVVATS
jgi:hypothetical protein